METTAVRLYGKNDLRLERFPLPAVGDDELLAEIVSNSICMSSYKALIQGADHKRVPADVAENPVIVGHEFCGRILEVGRNLTGRFAPGDKYGIQPALNLTGRENLAAGYSFRYFGGHATRIIIPREAVDAGCVLPYDGDGFFKASLAEPLSCIVGAFKTSYHVPPGEYRHIGGIQDGGRCAILAGAGPMGLCMLDYVLHGPRRPSLVAVTDLDRTRIERARALFPAARVLEEGIRLEYVEAAGEAAVSALEHITGGCGFDDVFVLAPVEALVEQGSRVLGTGGCLNFFAGPAGRDFSARVNFYDVHYAGHHMVGSSGGNTEDMHDAMDLISRERVNPAVMVTHIGGLNAVSDTIARLPDIPGGKKLIYTQKSLPLTALEDFAALGRTDPLFRDLASIVERAGGLWSVEAEERLLAGAPDPED